MRPLSLLCAALVIFAAFASMLLAGTVALRAVYRAFSVVAVEVARDVPFVRRFDARFPYPSASTLVNDAPTALIDVRRAARETRRVAAALVVDGFVFSLSIRQPRLSSQRSLHIDSLRARLQNSSGAFDLKTRYSETLKGTWLERTTRVIGFAPAGEVVDVLRVTLDPPLARATVSLELVPPGGAWGAARRTLTVLAATCLVAVIAAATIAITALCACATCAFAARYPVNKTAPRGVSSAGATAAR